METQQNSFSVLSQTYPPLVTQEDLSRIFRRSMRTIRYFLKDGTLPLQPIFPNSKPLFKLVDVCAFLDKPTPTPTLQKKGRKIGSKNKPKLQEQTENSPPAPSM